MDLKNQEDQKVDVNFESHPPIEQDLDGIIALLRQTLLQFVDCAALAEYLTELKDVTQVIALEATEEAPEDEDTGEEDEPDDDIYGVASVIELKTKTSDKNQHADARKHLTKFLKDKCSELKKLIETDDDKLRIGLVVNERYINLPPQLALPTLKSLTQHIDDAQFTHLIFVSKILLRSRSSNTQLASKKSKSGETSKKNTDAEPLIFVNPEEEIIFEHSDHHVDFDVSSSCDENATWSFNSDIKYIPHRRIMLIDKTKWPTILKDLEKELG